ncbi:MAG: hypothetical protein Q4A32_05440 [Lachnospiraceae bacterium]|nr:hypothetical protein [Lachnospiraceae bacterium]
MKKKRGILLCLAGVILTAIGILGRLSVAAHKSDIVIYQGISTFRTYMGGLNVVLAIGPLLSAIGIILMITSLGSKRAVERNIKDVEADRRQKKKSYSPDDIRESIRSFQDKYPEFPLNLCVRQLDQMDDYQLRLRELLDSNELEAFAYTEDILKDVESELCRDIKSFTNYMIVSDDANVTMDRYKSMLARNEERFGYVQSLLITLADFVNENIKSEDAVEKIKFCNEAIRDTFSVL